MSDTYKIDENNIVVKGNHYVAIDDIEGTGCGGCRRCYLGKSACGGLKRTLSFWCEGSNRKDGRHVIWVDVLKEKKAKSQIVIDNRSEYDKLVCDTILG